MSAFKSVIYIYIYTIRCKYTYVQYIYTHICTYIHIYIHTYTDTYYDLVGQIMLNNEGQTDITLIAE